VPDQDTARTEPRQVKVIAYGFDAIGFECPGPAPLHPAEGVSLVFRDMTDSTRLDEFDGAIIPQGLFERFEPQRGVFEPRVILQFGGQHT